MNSDTRNYHLLKSGQLTGVAFDLDPAVLLELSRDPEIIPLYRVHIRAAAIFVCTIHGEPAPRHDPVYEFMGTTANLLHMIENGVGSIQALREQEIFTKAKASLDLARISFASQGEPGK